jgi:hypothetical protein
MIKIKLKKLIKTVNYSLFNFPFLILNILIKIKMNKKNAKNLMDVCIIKKYLIT